MSENYVQKVIELAGATLAVEQPGSHDWNNLERDLQLTFPQDFKQLVSILGSGHFGGRLRLMNPNSRSKYLRLSHQALLEYRELVIYLEERNGISLYPNVGGLVVIAECERRHLLFRPDGTSLSDLVYLDYDYETLTDVNMSISKFLHDLFYDLIDEEWAKSFRSAIWPDSHEHFFVPLPRKI